MDSDLKHLAIDRARESASYAGPAVVFAEDDISTVPAKVVSAPINAVFVSLRSTGFELRSAGSNDIADPLSFDFCAAIAVSDAGDALLRSFRDHLAASDFPEITRIAPGGDLPVQVAIAVQAGLMQFLNGLGSRNSSLMSALAAVRREHEVLQNAFASLEEVVLTGNLPEKPAFTSTPTDRVLSTRDNWSPADTIIQRLPISSRAVSSIDLCFLVVDEGGKGHFEVRLQSLEDEAELGKWRVPFERIGAGWTQFQLDQALMGQPRTLQIAVKAATVEGEAPNLVLAAPSPLEDAVYQTSSGLQGECPLAFRVWRSLPGLRTKAAMGAISTGNQTGEQSSHRYLPAGQLGAAQPVIAGKTSATDLVHYFEESGELQVHPISNGLVAAYLKAAIPPFTSRLSAGVITRNAQADILDYSLLALPSRGAAESALARLARASESADGFSGWSAVPPMEPAKVSLSFASPPRTAMDLLLITRAHSTLSSGIWSKIWAGGRLGRGHTRYAWARFFDIEVELAQQ